MDIIAEIRRRYFVGHESISAIARSLSLSRPTVRKHLNTPPPSVIGWGGAIPPHQPVV
ncbi:hypothetical protein [Chitinivorax sp. B]|uniref:hypothetical protein n=1 Tax=Chitinivorax sp. B TaxID=2502235 RepID=UPI001484EEDC|nr:hypothetical protein [Chitinivorax sp. B]